MSATVEKIIERFFLSKKEDIDEHIFDCPCGERATDFKITYWYDSKLGFRYDVFFYCRNCKK